MEQKGEAELYRLKVDDLVTVLTHADPRENLSKPKNKAEGLERVRALAFVKAALERHVLAVAAASAPSPTPLTDPVLENADIILRQSVGSVGSFDPVHILPVSSVENVVL